MDHDQQEYRGHRVELRARTERPEAAAEGPEAGPELLIDGEPIRYRRLPDGRYFLEEYAYDWQENLMELARRFIDYQTVTDEVRREQGPVE
jgi:hypothetical protein